MTRPERQAALKALADARRNLADNQGEGFEEANEAVAEAEKQVRFGHARGWK